MKPLQPLFTILLTRDAVYFVQLLLPVQAGYLLTASISQHFHQLGGL